MTLVRNCVSLYRMKKSPTGALVHSIRYASATASASIEEIVPWHSSETRIPTGNARGAGAAADNIRIFSSLAAGFTGNRTGDAATADAANDSTVPCEESRSERGARIGIAAEEEHLPAESKEAVMSTKDVYTLASRTCTPLSLSNMYRYASANSTSPNYLSQRLRNAQFLHRELPIRIAQRAVDLLTLPHGLHKTVEVQMVTNIYLSYLRTFQNFPLPTNQLQEEQFTEMLHTMVLDRSSIPMAIAQGLASLSKNDSKQRLHEMEEGLYRFFTARIGLRLLTEHHILSSSKRDYEELRTRQSCLEHVPLPRSNHEDFFLGCIQANCNPLREVKRVADQVTRHCKECYGVAPEIEILDCTPDTYRTKDFTYVPHHLQYMLAELLKNSCRATVQRFLNGNVSYEDHTSLHNLFEGAKEGNHKSGIIDDSSIPPIRVVVVKGAEDVTIKIADKGGGVPRSLIANLWAFSHSSALFSDKIQFKESDTEFETDGFTGGNIRGFGLPLARIYARYFGGELILKSMEGYGVDAYLYLPMLGVACENLPRRVLLSPANHNSIHDGNHGGNFRGIVRSSNSQDDEPWGGTRSARPLPTAPTSKHQTEGL